MLTFFVVLDETISHLLPKETPALNRLFLRITHLGGLYTIGSIAFCSSVFLAVASYKIYAVGIWATLLATVITAESLKRIFKRARPRNAVIYQSGNALPSGHSACSLALYGYFIFVLHSIAFGQSLTAMASVIFVIVVLLVGFSRIYLRVHHASDVLLGYCIGAFFLALGIAFT